MGEQLNFGISLDSLGLMIRSFEGEPSAAMTARRVIYNKPATIVLWEDGTKTVVKCDERDTFDPKYGLALCYMKKALGNSSRNLNDALHSFLPAEKEGEE